MGKWLARLGLEENVHATPAVLIARETVEMYSMIKSSTITHRKQVPRIWHFDDNYAVHATHCQGGIEHD